MLELTSRCQPGLLIEGAANYLLQIHMFIWRFLHTILWVCCDWRQRRGLGSLSIRFFQEAF